MSTSPHNKPKQKRKIVATLSVILLVSVLLTKIIIIAYIYIDNPGNQGKEITIGNYKLNHIQTTLYSDDFNFSILPDDFSLDNLTELFTDFIWDYDGDSGHIDLVGFIYQYIPGLGANGLEFIQVFFYLSIFSGFIVLSLKINQARNRW